MKEAVLPSQKNWLKHVLCTKQAGTEYSGSWSRQFQVHGCRINFQPASILFPTANTRGYSL